MKSTVANDRIRRVVRTILGGVSTLSLGTLAAPALAQNAAAQTTAAPSATPADQPLQEITVTGIRASLQRALDVKQQSVGVVDAISAEDIGQFPDANLGEAIQRIPGVSVSRSMDMGAMGGLPTTTGDATEITVRGFGPTFNESLYDGRMSATATGNRGFDFSIVGSNFVQEVDILKTPDATLSAGAIGATINVKFPKPFDSPGLKLAGTGAASYSPHDGQVTPNGGVLFSDTFANDTFGVLAFVDYTKNAIKNNHINVQGWPGAATGTAANNIAPSQYAGTPPPNGSPNWFIQDYGIYQEYITDVRKDARLVFQWKPLDSMVVTLDDTRSEHDLTSQDYGFSVWFNPGTITNITRGSDGTLTSWTENTPTDFQGQFTGTHILSNMAGLNVAWDVTDTFKAELDADQSKARLNPNWQTTNLDADVGYGGNANNTNLRITGIGGNALPYLQNYGPNGNTADYLGQGILGSHVFPIQVTRNVDTINQAKIQGTWSGDNAKLKFGFQYTEDTFKLAIWDTFANNDWQAYSGYGPASNNTVGVALPQNFFTSSFSTANFVPGFANLNNLPPKVLMYSPYTVLNYLNSLHGTGNAGCCTPPFSGTYQLALNTGSVQNIGEKVYAPYVSLAQSTELGGMKLQTVLGVRYESTELATSALSQLPTSLNRTPGDPTNFTVGFGPTSLVTTSTNYRYLLPSLDLNLNITPDLKARFDASRTMTRPPLNLINPTLNLPTAERVGSLTANGGNPNLLPFLSDNIDFGVEWYYGPNSYISIDGFVKEVTNFIVAGTVQQPINGVIDPVAGGVAQFSTTTSVNGPSAEVRGIEVGVQHMFWDTGFGVQANATFVDTNRPYDPANTNVSLFAITGLANSANFVAFFEKWGFHARVALNWRDSYLDHFGQQQNTGAFGTEPTFVDSATELDFSTSYDFTNNLSVFFEGLNLTDETFSTHGRYKEQVLDAIDTGPRLTVGARYKF